MRFTSTRDKSLNSSFKHAILDCMPQDGGLFVPDGNADLRRWILYTNENTSFASIAGTLTLACINDEYSPIICETIATRAFPFEPRLSQLDENLFMLDLYHGPTGSHRDFGIAYLVSCLETILTMENRHAIILDVTTGEHGAILSRELRNTKNLKSILIYPKGKVHGLSETDYVWNGGNIYPVEFDGDEEECRKVIKEIFSDRDIVEKYNLTVSNTANIGRLMPQAFFYTFAFSRLKNKVCSDIYYAQAPGNYGNLLAGLYSWRLSLPVSGFIVPTTKELTVNENGYPEIADYLTELSKRPSVNPAEPSNLERLEDFFAGYSAMIKSFVYPAKISTAQTEDACRELSKKYGIFSDRHTASAYAAALAQKELTDEDGGAVVLVARDHPAYAKDFIQQCTGETIQVPEEIKAVQSPVNLSRPLAKNKEDIERILKEINF